MPQDFKYVIVDSDGKFDVRDTVHSAIFHDDRYYKKEEIFWMESVDTIDDLPETGNKHGDARIVVDVQNVFVWVEEETSDINGATVFIGEWLPIFGRYWSEPVSTYTDLPSTGNLDGEIRLVVDSATIYRYSEDTSSWNAINQPAVMAFWQAPVSNAGSLPLTGNAGGDVRVTLNNNQLNIWNGTTFEWEVIEIESDLYWGQPVATEGDLPLTGNRDGEVRLVKDTNGMWRWKEGTSEWIEIQGGSAVSVGYEERSPSAPEASGDYITLLDASVTDLLPTASKTPTELRASEIYVAVYLNGMRMLDSEWSYGYVTAEKRIEFDGTGSSAVDLDTSDDIAVEVIKTST